jgi:short subunit dehydrogenase-like uncharacterized protein
MTVPVLIYGVTGYTGHLIARTAVARGLRPMIGGRSSAKLQPIASTLGLDYRAFALNDPKAMDHALADVAVLLDCAGPFEQSGAALAAGCIRTQTHYLDLSGEYPQFEAMAALDQAAQDANIMLMPGVGFGVVPTDCLAVYLKQRLPTANHLALAFETIGGVSQGTAQTLFKDIMNGGVVRRNGSL